MSANPDVSSSRIGRALVRVTVAVLAGLVLLIGATVTLLHLAPVTTAVVRLALERALPGQLAVGIARASGNPLGALMLDSLIIRRADGDTALQAERLALRYDLSALWSHRVRLAWNGRRLTVDTLLLRTPASLVAAAGTPPLAIGTRVTATTHFEVRADPAGARRAHALLPDAPGSADRGPGRCPRRFDRCPGVRRASPTPGARNGGDRRPGSGRSRRRAGHRPREPCRSRPGHHSHRGKRERAPHRRPRRRPVGPRHPPSDRARSPGLGPVHRPRLPGAGRPGRRGGERRVISLPSRGNPRPAVAHGGRPPRARERHAPALDPSRLGRERRGADHDAGGSGPNSSETPWP